MADLAAIRQAIADSLVTADPETTIKAHARYPDQFHAPAAIVDVDDVDFKGAMQRGLEKWNILVRYLVSTTNIRGAETKRDEVFGGVKDIKDRIEAHVPLRDGTVAHDVYVSGARRFDAWEYAGSSYLGVEFVVEVYA